MTEDVREELKSVPMTLDVPGRIAEDVNALVAAGVYLSPGEALRGWIHSEWRYQRGTYHTLRLDLGSEAGSTPENDVDERDGAGEA